MFNTLYGRSQKVFADQLLVFYMVYSLQSIIFSLWEYYYIAECIVRYALDMRITVTVQGASATTRVETLPSIRRSTELPRAPKMMWST